MKTPHVLLVFHSASGNTAWGARTLAACLRSAQVRTTVHSITDGFDNNLLSSHDLIGFGCPVMGFQPSSSMMDFIRGLPAQHNKPAFVFATYAGILANSLWVLADALSRRGFTTIARACFRCEVSWPVARMLGLLIGRGRPDARTAEGIRDFAHGLGTAAERLAAGKTVPRVKIPFQFANIFGYIGRMADQAALRMIMGSKKVRTAACTRCGLCRRWCAAGAIQLQPYPVFSSACNGCWGCYNICPEGAIETFIGGRGRYRTRAGILMQLDKSTAENTGEGFPLHKKPEDALVSP